MPRNEDWRPKLTRIDEPIADDYWEYVTPEGQQRISRLTVGRPVHYPQEQVWYCPVFIEGYTTPRIKPIFGSGPVDSLMNAMSFVRGFFEENSKVLPGAKPKGANRTRSTSHGTRPTSRGQLRKAHSEKPRRHLAKPKLRPP
ncbi:hypothetical protein POL68_31960 [Stigmatella sp. ncwal1]|uniref:HNH endonuclease n=1 Tax=Stigmatella ashevillensis TaxID=2995309 RepID=A0ABT5DHI4_9BACT|nr:hypothetical protein [Stigmatella ashevillena]MDC0713122.1 hypothetical protein [Stigmatella ashevillena]